MKSIGFKNFRKFVDFPSMKFNDITLMVGRNNSGKSTLVKAIILVVNYLKNHQNQVFPFTTNNVNDVNIVSFDRARCKFQSTDIISFTSCIGHYRIYIELSGDKNTINGNVEKVVIFDSNTQIKFLFDLSEKSLEISQKKKKGELENETGRFISEINKQIFEAENKIDSIAIPDAVTLQEIANLNKQLSDLKYRKEMLIESNAEEMLFSYAVSYDISFNAPSNGNNFISYIKEFLNSNEDEKRLLVTKKAKSDINEDDLIGISQKLEEVNLIQESSSSIIASIDEFVQEINDNYYYYWSAETQKQSALFSIRDDNNALAKAIHDFCGLNIQEGDEESVFIQNQLKEFEVGVDFKLTPHVGEAYECDVKEESGVVISLADKGMGSIQLMTLFFRLASIIRKHKNQLKYDNEQITYNGKNMLYGNHSGVTLIIEEPELNLHPILQEKLMVLFNYVMNKYRIRFIIETHSEYLIRKSQLIVVDNGYTAKIEGVDNMPISVYFFTSENKAENMQLGEDGKFERDFEPGFINVADDAAVELFEKTV